MVALLSGCFSSVEVNYPEDPSGGGQGTVPATMSFTEFAGTAIASLPKDPQGRMYVNTHTVAVQAECSRGISTATLTVNGTRAPGSYPCAFSRKVNASFDVTADGAYTIALTPVGSQGSVIGNTITATIFVKKTPPPAPILLEPSPLITTGGPVVIHGTFSALESDAIQTVTVSGAPGSTSVNLGAGTFTFSFNSVPGVAYNLAFRTRDYAQNLSTPTPFAVFANAVLAVSGFVPVAPAPTTSTNSLLAFTSAPVLTSPAVSTRRLYIGLAAVAGDPP